MLELNWIIGDPVSIGVSENWLLIWKKLQTDWENFKYCSPDFSQEQQGLKKLRKQEKKNDQV